MSQLSRGVRQVRVVGSETENLRSQSASSSTPRSSLPPFLLLPPLSSSSLLTYIYLQAGDLIPWTISQQFQDAEFAGLSGARVVRIATHPEVSRMGYGSRAVELLSKFYAGELIGVDEAAAAKTGRKEK
eukprot:757197-Hanusia_phi.AAC.1